MIETEQFTIGAEASCSDGSCGEVSRVVIDPVAQAVTHLVVEPKHRQGLGRLVPLDLVEVVEGEVQVRCTKAEFDKLDPAEETEFLPGSYGYPAFANEGYSADQLLYRPYYGLGMGLGGLGVGGVGMGNAAQSITVDSLPPGEVGVRRGEQVHASDGPIGKVQGLVIDPRDHHVTHVLLQEGHLWGRKEVAIPIGAVVGVEGGIHLNLTKEVLKDLPAIDVDHWGTWYALAPGDERGPQLDPRSA